MENNKNITQNEYCAQLMNATIIMKKIVRITDVLDKYEKIINNTYEKIMTTGEDLQTYCNLDKSTIAKLKLLLNKIGLIFVNKKVAEETPKIIINSENCKQYIPNVNVMSLIFKKEGYFIGIIFIIIMILLIIWIIILYQKSCSNSTNLDNTNNTDNTDNTNNSNIELTD
jgi:hypothetical protein